MALRDRIDRVVLPGQTVGAVPAEGAVRVGHGLAQAGDAVVATKAGVLRHRAPDTYYVENSQMRYVPTVDDLVVGIVTDRHADGWRVDLGCHLPATLSMYAFEGATKKNRPTLAVGALVYARVSVASRDVEPEIVCTNAKGKAEGFGPLEGGYVFKCSTGLARECLDENCAVLNALGEQVPYEVAVGVNGRIWVRAATTAQTVLVANAIQNSEYLTPDQARAMVAALARKSKALRR